MGLWPGPVSAQTTDELVNDGKNTDNVTTQSMGYDRKSYSPLKQINKSNVKRLVPIWSTSLMNDSGELAAPTIYNGVMYVINGKWTFAIDVETGKQIWRTPVELEPGGASASAHHRGAATIYNGKLFRVTIDNHLLALDMKTGKELWNQKFADWQGGLLRHQRADRRQRRPDFRHGRRRVHHARIPRRLGSRHRQEVVAPIHHPGARRAWLRDLAARTATPGCGAADRRGARAPTIRSSTSSTGAPATPSPTIPGRATAGQSVHLERAGDPAEDRRARLLLTNTRPTTSTTSTAPTNTCWPTSRSTASRER